MDRITRLLTEAMERLRVSHPGFGWMTAMTVDSIWGYEHRGLEIWVEQHGAGWRAYGRGTGASVAESRFDRVTPEEAVQAVIDSPAWRAATRRAA